jgi:hypothetical protein
MQLLQGNFGVGCKIGICGHAKYFGACGRVINHNLLWENCMVTSRLNFTCSINGTHLY